MAKSKDLMNPAELLKSQLAETNQRINTSESIRIKLDGKEFTTPDGKSGKKINVAIIDFAMVHSYYDRPYDSNNPMPPACFAVAQDRNQLAPVAESPVPQAERCAVCEQNKFGSAPNSKAKACKNTRVLAVVPLDDLREAPIWLLSVPPNATGTFDKYVQKLANEQELTPLFVMTEITQNSKLTYASPVFEFIEPLSKDLATDAISRLEEARQLVTQVPDFTDYKAP